MKISAIIALFLLGLLPINVQAQDGKSPFCDQVNAARKQCALAKYDCSIMNGNLDAKTLDTIDQIKSCPTYDSSSAHKDTTQQSIPNLPQLVCCLASGR